MATYIEDRHMNPARTTLVRSDCLGKNYRAKIEWLTDSSRPGSFSFLSVITAHTYSRELVGIRFTDPDVAFEFKMRWV